VIGGFEIFGKSGRSTGYWREDFRTAKRMSVMWEDSITCGVRWRIAESKDHGALAVAHVSIDNAS
jgi:hypothetical protein